MNPRSDNIAYLRHESEVEPQHTTARQAAAMRKYWEAKYGPGPNTETCMAISVIVLVLLHCIVFPFFLITAIQKAVTA